MRDWVQKDSVWPYVRLFLRVILTVVALWLLGRIVPFVFSLFLPFIFAYLVATVLNPFISFAQRKWKIPRGFLSVFLVGMAILAVLAIVGGLVYTLVREMVSLAQNVDEVVESINDTLEIIAYHLSWLSQYMPAELEEMVATATESFMEWLSTQGTVLAESVIAGSVEFTTRIGGGVITTVIFIMAAYFVTADYPRLNEKLGGLRAFLGKQVYGGYLTLQNAAFSALGQYLRAQLLLALVAFFFMLIGLLIIQQEYAVLLALMFAVIDFIPLVGLSVVLVPWAVVNLVGGEIVRGIYLLVLAFIFFLIRRVLEPKVMSSQSGLSPLVTLISIYLGMQFGGLFGMIFGPIVAMMLLSAYKAGFFNGWVSDINAVIDLHKRQDHQDSDLHREDTE